MGHEAALTVEAPVADREGKQLHQQPRDARAVGLVERTVRRM